LQLLDEFNIKYKINYYLVRGLDYYNDVVFEFVSTSDALGSKSTILAGGRYNGMVEQFGGPKIDSIGFAFGVDRLMEIVEYDIDKYPELNNQVDILIGYMNNAEKDIILKVAYDLRKKYSVMLINRKISLKDFFKKQFFLKPRFIVFKELNSKPNEIKIKNSQNEIITKYTNINDFEKAIKALEKEK
jgi:Histidyl-tRNA synthetase